MAGNLTTLCYIERDGAYLMLHRVKKEKDINKDKWIGVGGHFEDVEETGLKLTDYRLRGVITFSTESYPVEYMFLYTAEGFSGTMHACDEGDLEWVPKEQVYELPVWEGDKIFFRLLEERRVFFSLKLRDVGDTLAEAVLDGKDRLV